jgi:hypothetical protein
MPRKLKNYIMIITTLFSFSLPALLPATAFACNNIQNNLNSGINAAVGSSSACGGSGSGVKNGIGAIAVEAVNILSLVVGIVAVIMIIYGGFKYITSGGESGNVSGAKNTLIYAIVGLVIVALAQVIVHWVLNTSSNISSGGTTPAGFIRFL